MRIIVNDANILIDLVELHILREFFALEFEFHTTDLVLAELDETHRNELIGFIQTGDLKVRELSAKDMLQVSEIRSLKRMLSIPDCSTILCAEKVDGVLLTSDNVLRKFAKERSTEVHGHLWVFDRMWEAKLLTGQELSVKLTLLTNEINRRLGLPQRECEARKKLWQEYR